MSEAFASAQRVSVWTQPQARGPAPFTAWGEALRAAFEPPADAIHVPEIPVDIEAERNEAFGDGYEAGLADGRAEAEPEKAALARLATSLGALRPAPSRALGSMIAATVERLLVELMGQVTIDRDTLVARSEAAAALIGEETRPALLRLNPADAARLAGVTLAVPIEADPAIGAGAIRLETGDGWIEDSPALRLDKLRGALDRVAAAR